MKFFRNNIFRRIFCILMAIHIFNLSVDTKDAQPDCVAEDLSINDQETIVEIVLEKVLGIENAIAEQDEPDQEDSGELDFEKIDLISHHSHRLFFELKFFQEKSKINYLTSFHQSPTFDVFSPPPEA
jgi:hypothetical protein